MTRSFEDVSMQWPMALRDFCAQVGTQTEAAKQLGLATPTISLMLSRNRKIFVLPDGEGKLTYYEIKQAQRGGM